MRARQTLAVARSVRSLSTTSAWFKLKALLQNIVCPKKIHPANGGVEVVLIVAIKEEIDESCHEGNRTHYGTLKSQNSVKRRRCLVSFVVPVAVRLALVRKAHYATLSVSCVVGTLACKSLTCF